MPDGLLRRARSQLLLVDVQEKLVPAMHGMDAPLHEMAKLITSARTLDIPLTVAEQNPKGLGHTVPALRALLDGAPIFEKTAFSCAAHRPLRDAIQQHASAGRDQLVITGLEAHVCVLQTAIAFRDLGLQTFVVADATAARSAHSIAAAEQRLRAAGVTVVSAEMAFFEWLADAADPAFAALRHLVR
jgi:nicotinamidase-related amidase